MDRLQTETERHTDTIFCYVDDIVVQELYDLNRAIQLASWDKRFIHWMSFFLLYFWLKEDPLCW
jgi:hypothetical protein